MRAPESFKLDVPHAALVITDPQVDFLSPRGATWSVVGASVQRNNTVQNIERLLKAARQADMVVAISPHYYYSSDHRWGFGGPLERLMDRIRLLDRGVLTVTESETSGADLLPSSSRTCSIERRSSPPHTGGTGRATTSSRGACATTRSIR